MDSQNNFDVNNLFSTGLEPNLHPLLAPTSLFPTTSTAIPSSFYTPVHNLPIYHSALPITAASIVTSIPVIQPIASGITLNNLFTTVTTKDPLLQPVNPLQSISALKIYRAPLAAAAITVAPPLQPIHNLAIQAGGIVKFNEQSNLDSNPLDKTSDAFVYGEHGFSFNDKSILPVQRDASGNPLKNSQGQYLLVDQALVVGSSTYTVNVNDNSQYANLNHPQLVTQQPVVVPSFATTSQQELAARIPTGAVSVNFNAQQTPINNPTQWAQKFPAPGTATQPKVVHVTSGNLNIPDGVNLSNYVIIVDNGNINGNDSATLTNVVLVASKGNINLGQVRGENVSILASGSINTNDGASLGGNSLLANGSGDITFNGKTSGTTSLQNLRVISQGRITFNGAATVRGSFLSAGTFTANENTVLFGTVASQKDIVFNDKVALTYINFFPSVITASLAVDSGSSSSDKLTNDPTMAGKITNNAQVVTLIAGFDATSASKWTNITPSLQANGTFILSRTQINQIYGANLSDGTHTLHLSATDKNAQLTSFDVTFTLDTTLVAPSLQLAATSDTGVSSSDKITKINTPVITGTGEVGAAIQLKDGTTVVGQTTVGTDGKWQVTTSQLTNGSHSLIATAVDGAGNIASSTALTVVIDALAPSWLWLILWLLLRSRIMRS